MIEIIATSFSLLSVYLGAKNNTLTWPIGIIGIIFYGILFYNNNIMGNMSLQLLFLIQSIYGWLKWKDVKDISKLSRRKSGLNVSYCIIISCIITFLLYVNGGNNPVLDGVTTGMSIIGLLLMSFRKVDSWYYWIIVDILFVVFFIKVDLYLSAITYFIFFILAIYGLKEWRQISKTD